MASQKGIVEFSLVEISGWDAHEEFFVEHAVLDPMEARRVRAYLMHAVRPGAVLFVRDARQPVETCCPVAYQVESVSTPDARGARIVNLAEVRPRRQAQDSRTQTRAERIEPNRRAS
jgi:hypothetical protein